MRGEAGTSGCIGWWVTCCVGIKVDLHSTCNRLNWFQGPAAEHQSAEGRSLERDKLAPQDARVGGFTCLVRINFDLYSTCNRLSWFQGLAAEHPFSRAEQIG